MHWAYVARTETSVSWTRYRTFGMMYSGKMETLDGVITVTLMSWTEFSISDKQARPPTICMSVLTAAARTTATSSRNSSTTYGTARSSLDSSVSWAQSARRMSSARMRDEGREQFRMFARTRERRMRAGPSSAGVGRGEGV